MCVISATVDCDYTHYYIGKSRTTCYIGKGRTTFHIEKVPSAHMLIATMYMGYYTRTSS